MKKNLFFFSLLVLLLSLGSARTYGQYCIPTMPIFGSGCIFGDEIDDFILPGENSTGINDIATGCVGATGYDDRTAQPAVDLMEDTDYTATASTGFSSNYCSIWIDFNDDEIFQSTERVGGSPNGQAVSTTTGSAITVSIPAGVTTGNRRMRVMIAYSIQSIDQDPCNNGLNQANYFEVHDYTVNIIGNNPCAGTPDAGLAAASVSTINCIGDVDLSLLNASDESGLSYQWESSTDGINWQTTGGTTADYTAIGVNITTQFRCLVTCIEVQESAYSVPVTVTVNGPGVDLGPDRMVCPGTTLTLDAGDGASTFSWNTGETSSEITVSTPGVYSVTATDAAGCTMTDEIIIGEGQDPSNNLSAEAEICDGAIYTLNAGNPGSSYLWSTGETSQSIDASTQGNYTVTITNEDGCVLNTGTNLTVHPLPVIDLGNDTTVCDGVVLVLDAENTGSSYLWNTGDTTQTIDIGEEGNYAVTVTTTNGCIDEEDFTLTILPQPYVEGFNFVPMFYDELGRVQFAPLLPVAVLGYEWDFGDGSPLDFQETVEHTYTSNGNYLVTLKVSNYCGSYSTAQMIYVDHVTGIRDAGQASTQLKLYPNPATELIHVELEGAEHIEQIKVYNLLGAVVYQKELQTTSNQHQFSVKQWASGIYTISIITEAGSIQRKIEVIR